MSANLNAEIRKAIEGTLADAFPSTAIAWQNTPFTPPKGLWLRPFISYGSEAPAGYHRDALTGAFVVEVFGEVAKGVAPVLEAIALLKKTFYRQWIDGIRFPSVLAVRNLEGIESHLGYAIDFQFIAHSDL